MMTIANKCDYIIRNKEEAFALILLTVIYLVLEELKDFLNKLIKMFKWSN